MKLLSKKKILSKTGVTTVTASAEATRAEDREGERAIAAGSLSASALTAEMRNMASVAGGHERVGREYY